MRTRAFTAEFLVALLAAIEAEIEAIDQIGERDLALQLELDALQQTFARLLVS